MQNLNTSLKTFLHNSIPEAWNSEMKDNILYFNNNESIVVLKRIQSIQYAMKQKKVLLNS